MSEVDYAERVRMALAEVGVERHVSIGPEGVEVHSPGDVPDRVFWQAFVVAKSPNIWCWTCFSLGNHRKPDCLAIGQGIEDCGVQR